MNKELQELEKRIKKCRSKIMKNNMLQIMERCSEVYGNIDLIELQLIWYLRQFSKYKPHCYLDIAKSIYRAKVAIERSIEEEKQIGIDKLQ